MTKNLMGIFTGILIENVLLFAIKGCNVIQKPTQSESVGMFSSVSVAIQPTTESVPSASLEAPSTAEVSVAIDNPFATMKTHSHKWEAVTRIIHHDAVTDQVWKEDMASWDENVETKLAWDEQILTQKAWDETVLVQDEYDEPVYKWLPVCNVCNYQFPTGTTADQLEYHIFDDPGCGGGWHDIQVQTESIHHNAVYQVIHHEAIYQTIHHEAETATIHHEAIGHYETVVIQDAWDETTVTGYQCSVCGEISTM